MLTRIKFIVFYVSLGTLVLTAVVVCLPNWVIQNDEQGELLGL